jgi:type IV secretory pathway TrbL component
MYSRATRCAAEPDGLGSAASASTCAIARSAEKLAGPPPGAVGGHKLLSETAAMIAMARVATIGAARSITREEGRFMASRRGHVVGVGSGRRILVESGAGTGVAIVFPSTELSLDLRRGRSCHGRLLKALPEEV